MYDGPQRFNPFPIFVALFAPLMGVAVALAILAGRSAPELATLLFLGLGFLGFVYATDCAAAGKIPAVMSLERTPPIRRVLEMRRNRLWHAFSFAATGVAMILLMTPILRFLGLESPIALEFGHLMLIATLLMTAAWIVIGGTACSQSAIRRALTGIEAGN